MSRLPPEQVRARAGGMKRKRGRLEIEISVLKSHFSVVDLRVKVRVRIGGASGWSKVEEAQRQPVARLVPASRLVTMTVRVFDVWRMALI